VVPQQPPIICAPALIRSMTLEAMNSGVSLKTVFSPSRTGRPALALMRIQIRRFTSLTNAFSKKWENHYAALALWFAYYNSVRIHSAICVTPATEAGLTDHIWTLRELLSKIGQ